MVPARLGDSKTGPLTLWLGSEAELLAGLLRAKGATHVFPEGLTEDRLRTFWRGGRITTFILANQNQIFQCCRATAEAHMYEKAGRNPLEDFSTESPDWPAHNSTP